MRYSLRVLHALEAGSLQLKFVAEPKWNLPASLGYASENALTLKVSALGEVPLNVVIHEGTHALGASTWQGSFQTMWRAEFRAWWAESTFLEGIGGERILTPHALKRHIIREYGAEFRLRETQLNLLSDSPYYPDLQQDPGSRR